MNDYNDYQQNNKMVNSEMNINMYAQNNNNNHTQGIPMNSMKSPTGYLGN